MVCSVSPRYCFNCAFQSCKQQLGAILLAVTPQHESGCMHLSYSPIFSDYSFCRIISICYSGHSALLCGSPVSSLKSIGVTQGRKYNLNRTNTEVLISVTRALQCILQQIKNTDFKQLSIYTRRNSGLFHKKQKLSDNFHVVIIDF